MQKLHDKRERQGENLCSLNAKAQHQCLGACYTRKKTKCSDLHTPAMASVRISNVSKFSLPAQRHQLNNELSITAQNVIRLTDTSAIFSCTC